MMRDSHKKSSVLCNGHPASIWALATGWLALSSFIRTSISAHLSFKLTQWQAIIWYSQSLHRKDGPHQPGLCYLALLLWRPFVCLETFWWLGLRIWSRIWGLETLTYKKILVTSGKRSLPTIANGPSKKRSTQEKNCTAWRSWLMTPSKSFLMSKMIAMKNILWRASQTTTSSETQFTSKASSTSAQPSKTETKSSSMTTAMKKTTMSKATWFDR